MFGHAAKYAVVSVPRSGLSAWAQVNGRAYQEASLTVLALSVRAASWARKVVSMVNRGSTPVWKNSLMSVFEVEGLSLVRFKFS